MSILAIEADIFKWLQSLQIIKQGKRNSLNQIQLSQQISCKFFDGLYISKIIRSIIQSQSMSQTSQNFIVKMKSIKQNSTPAIRLYNWNLITDVLKYLGYPLDYAQKSKILNMQSGPMIKLLSYLKGLYKKQESVIRGQNSSSVPQKKLMSPGPISQHPLLSVDIKTLPTKTVLQSQNILQFITISLSKNFKLSAHHTLNLYLDNNKYLAHLLVKGIKESFQPIRAFLNDVLSNMDFIVMRLFMLDQQSSFNFFVEALKPCLISKDLNVAITCFDIFQLIHTTYHQNQLDLNFIKKWMLKQGVNTLLFCSKRHQQTFQTALSLSYKFLEEQLFQFIRPNDKSPFWTTDYQKLHLYYMLLVVADDSLLQKFNKSTCLIQWNNFCLKSIKRLKNVKQITLLIKILRNSWILFPDSFTQSKETDYKLADGYVAFLKASSFSNDFMLFVQSIKTMFDLMEILGKRKNNFAPVVFKTLVNCLSFESGEDRVTFIIENFISVFKLIQNLPGALVIQPLLKSIQRNCTVASLNLCRLLIFNQKIKQDDMTQIIEIFTKVFFQDINHGSIAIDYAFDCIQFIDQQIQHQFLVKNSQLCLSHFYSLAQSIKRPLQALKSQFRRYQNESSMKQGQSVFQGQVKKYLLIQNLIKFLTLSTSHQQNVLARQYLQEAIFMTYIKTKHELKKQYVANLLLHGLMKKYYDVHEELISVIDSYENKYFDYLRNQQKNKGFFSIQQDQSNQSPSPISQKRMYASKSMILDDSLLQNSSRIRPQALKPQKTALKHLESLKKKFESMRIVTQQDEKKKDIIQQKKQLVRSIINQRRQVKFGVKHQPNMQYKFLFEFDTVKVDRNINGLPTIELTNLQTEQEDIFVNDVDCLMKKYRKVWRFLFFKYSTFGAKKTNQIKNQQKINIAEIWKMHRQYSADIIKKQQSFAIVKIINQNMKRKNDLQHLTYLGFEQYIMQFCIYGYNQLGITTLSPGQKVLKLLQQLKKVTKQKNGNIQLFNNPQQIYFQQSQVIKEYNRRLLSNPEYILPQGYKKVKQTQYVYQYQFTQQTRKTFQHANLKFVHNQTYFDVLEVLSQIFYQHQKLNFHLVQPKTAKLLKVLAKPVVFQDINQKMKNYKGGYLMPKRAINSTYVAPKDKINPFKPQFHPLVEFSLGIKLGLSAVSHRNKFIAEQVAYWIDDMLDAVESGAKKVSDKAKIKIQNQAIKNKKMMIYKLKKQTKQKQKYYKERSQSVKIQFEKIQTIKQQVMKQRILKTKLIKQQQKSRQKLQMQKKLLQFKKAKQYFSLKHQKQKSFIQQVNNKKQKQKSQYKKNVQQYFKKKKQQLSQKDAIMIKNRQFQKSKLIQDNQKQANLQKKVYLHVLKKDQQALQRVEEIRERYDKFRIQKFVEDQFQLQRKGLNLLFQLLIKFQKSKISTTDKNQISQNTFQFFALKFKIVPFMIQKNTISSIFRSVGKDLTNKSGSGLSYRGFEQALLKIVIKSKKMLNQLIQKKRQKLLQSSSIIKQQPESQNLQQNKSLIQNLDSSKLSSSKFVVNQNLAEDYLFDCEGVTQQTIRQFMVFLNLPDDKLSMEIRYRQAVQTKNNKPTTILKRQLKEEIINGYN